MVFKIIFLLHLCFYMMFIMFIRKELIGMLKQILALSRHLLADAQCTA